MSPRLSRPLFKHWSEIPLAIGLLIVAGILLKQCLIYWDQIQRMGGFWQAVDAFFNG